MKFSLVQLALCLTVPHISAFGKLAFTSRSSPFATTTTKLASSALSSPPSVTNDAATSDIPSIVPFGGSARSQDKPDKQIVGGKGLGLQEMSRIGVDVPPGFTLTTAVCRDFQDAGDLTEAMWHDVKEAVKRIEADMGKGYGDAKNPLLFSCRSGAAVSMVRFGSCLLVNYFLVLPVYCLPVSEV